MANEPTQRRPQAVRPAIDRPEMASYVTKNPYTGPQGRAEFSNDNIDRAALNRRAGVKPSTTSTPDGPLRSTSMDPRATVGATQTNFQFTNQGSTAVSQPTPYTNALGSPAQPGLQATNQAPAAPSQPAPYVNALGPPAQAPAANNSTQVGGYTGPKLNAGIYDPNNQWGPWQYYDSYGDRQTEFANGPTDRNGPNFRGY